MIYLNELDAGAAEWCRELMAAGEIPEGTVDERDIREVRSDDLTGYRQCHFFAGIAGWSLALRLAGWPSERPLWTGSCPCQPFSAAGKRKGEADARHLWPEFFRLIAECRPSTIFGEQVASRDGRQWLAGVRADLEALGYAVGSADLCAAGEGSPHIRQRLFWVACHSSHPDITARKRTRHAESNTRANGWIDACGLGEACLPSHAGQQPSRQHASGKGSRKNERAEAVDQSGGCDRSGHARNAASNRRQEYVRRQRTCEESDPENADAAGRASNGPCNGWGQGSEIASGSGEGTGAEGAGQRPADDLLGRNRFWDSFDVIDYRDGKKRRVEPGTFPLAHGLPGRVGLLRGYGNAIVPQVAATFIKAFLNTEVPSC